MKKPRSETLTIRDAAREYPRVGRNHLYEEAAAGRLPHLKIGNRIVLVRATFEAYLRERSENGG